MGDQMAGDDNVEWLAPWHSVADDPIQAASMKRELGCELFYGLRVRTLGRRKDCDDVLFGIEDGSGRVAVVHLTFTSNPEQPPCPWTVLHASFDAWVTEGMQVDQIHAIPTADPAKRGKPLTLTDHELSPFLVYKTTMLGFVPVGRLYYCIRCEQELSEWVMKQPADESSACPHCHYPIQAEHIAQAQRETKVGCLLSLLGFASLFLIPAAIIAVTLLLSRP